MLVQRFYSPPNTTWHHSPIHTHSYTAHYSHTGSEPPTLWLEDDHVPHSPTSVGHKQSVCLMSKLPLQPSFFKLPCEREWFDSGRLLQEYAYNKPYVFIVTESASQQHYNWASLACNSFCWQHQQIKKKKQSRLRRHLICSTDSKGARLTALHRIGHVGEGRGGPHYG